MPLRLISLNTWGLPYGVAPDLPRRTEALAATFAENAADVLALQEVWTTRARDHLRDAATSAGFEHAFFIPASRANAGLLLCSKWPFSNGQANQYRVRGRAERIDHGDFWGGKGWLDVTLDTPDGAVRVVDTHIHAAYSDAGQPGIYASERMAQVVELAHGLKRGSVPVIALGDFNMREDSEEYAVWIGLSGSTDMAASLEARRSTIPNAAGAWERFSVERRIDYAFFRDGTDLAVRPLRIARVFDENVALGAHAGPVSDHAGLSIDIELVARDGPPADATAAALIRRSEAVELARTRLDEAATRTEARARRQTTLGLAGLVASGVAGFAGDLATRHRRGVLRALVFGVPALGLVASGITVALGQAFTSSAAQQFSTAAALLDDFEPK